jgi:hypothetical protein
VDGGLFPPKRIGFYRTERLLDLSACNGGTKYEVRRVHLEVCGFLVSDTKCCRRAGIADADWHPDLPPCDFTKNVCGPF